jgi:hypothetical protein
MVLFEKLLMAQKNKRMIHRTNPIPLRVFKPFVKNIIRRRFIRLKEVFFELCAGQLCCSKEHIYLGIVFFRNEPVYRLGPGKMNPVDMNPDGLFELCKRRRYPILISDIIDIHGVLSLLSSGPYQAGGEKK